MVQMMWFRRDPKPTSEKAAEKDNGVGKLSKKKQSLLKPTRESSERETSTESDKERRRYSDILDMKVSLERRDESDESLYESADGHSDAISASDDAIPRLSKTPTISKESLKIAVTDEEVETKFKKGHRKAMSLSNPLEIVKNLSDEWLIAHKKELEKNSDKKKSRESLWSEEDRDSINGSSTFLDQIRKNSRKEDKSQSNSRKSSTADPPKTRKTSKGSSVSALNFLRRKKTPTSTKPVEVVPEDPTKVLSFDEILNYTRLFLECEQRFASIENKPVEPPKPSLETDSDDEEPTPKQLEQHRRRLSRQTSRSKSKARGKSQSLKINTLRKSHSGTLKKNKGKKGSAKAPSIGRSRQASIVEQTPLFKKKHSQSMKQNWLFSGRGETRREGSNEEPTAPDADVDTSDAATKDSDKDNTWRAPPSSGRGVNRAESCRERDAPRRGGKHRNASDPNRLTAHNNNDLEPGSANAPSGSSSSSSLSSRSNESNTVAAEQQASQSDLSDEEEVGLAAQWSESISPHILSSICLSARLRKRQEVIHELIVSEGSHVRWLKVLGRVFLRPLEKQPHLLPPEELRALFPNLPSVKERHVKLYSELRALRNDVDAPLVDISAVADAMLNTLGDVGYASTLARFCRGQRMALEALRERRRKNKELQQFLTAREQQPRCGRLQLRDLLACVWQRLTKYQLLLESVLKTVEAEESAGADRVQRALAQAKEVLHSVDTAIRTAENEHRLRSIQSKLEIRPPAGGGGGGLEVLAEWADIRRLDLSHHTLRLEGELNIRNDSTKKIQVLALLLEDFLLLLQREGDKFILKPIPQPSQQQNLLPLIKWDKVLFRPNAAVRNTFFLMHINGVQMHELSANSASEYATWVKHIQEAPLAPLAKLTELKPNITPSHQASRSTDDSGINVSRNPSDASEKSNSTVDGDREREESERDRLSAERTESERDRASVERTEETERSSVERERSVEKGEPTEEKDIKHKIRCPTVGRISTHAESPPPSALTVQEHNVHTAHTALSNHERLRRLDAGIARCLRGKAAVVADMLAVPRGELAQLADIAVAEALGEVDVSGELRARGEPVEEAAGGEDDVQQLLLAACTQANQLTLLVRGALSVSEAGAAAARAGGTCGACRRARGAHTTQPPPAPTVQPTAPPPPEETDIDSDMKPAALRNASLEEYDTLSELDVTRDEDDDVLESSVSAALLASRLVEVTCGLQSTLARLLSRTASSVSARAGHAHLRDTNDALRAALRTYELQSAEEIPFPKMESTIQDQPSNGG